MEPSTGRPRVLFLCTGNICRSPTAHALLLHKAGELGLDVHVDSAGISGEEQGRPPDRRSVAEARRRGIAMPVHVARQVRTRDFEDFDWLVGMTRAHCEALERLSATHAHKVWMLMAFADGGGEDVDVPDPWYGGAAHFVQAFDMIERGVDGLIARLQAGGSLRG